MSAAREFTFSERESINTLVQLARQSAAGEDARKRLRDEFGFDRYGKPLAAEPAPKVEEPKHEPAPIESQKIADASPPADKWEGL